MTLSEELKHIGPMAQDVQRRFPDRVYAGPDGFLRIKLDDLPPGITPFDLYAPVAKADVSLALQRWSRVFSHWMEKDK